MTTAIERHASLLSSLPRSAVISDRSAAQHWGLWTPEFSGLEVTSAAGWRGSSYTTGVQRHAVIANRRVLPSEDVTVHLGVHVTTLERTWLDLAGHLSLLDLVAAGDSALRAGATVGSLSARLSGARRVRGITRAREAVLLLDRASRSRPESRIRAAIVLAGLPAPLVNRPVHDDVGQWIAEPDLQYPEARLAIEYNGAEHAGQLSKDATRVLDLQRAGWEVRVYTAPQAFRHIDDVVRDVRGLLLRRAPHLLAHVLSGRMTTSRPA